jgi:hypothetical protein
VLAAALSPIAAVMLQGELSAALLVRAAKLAYLRAAVSEMELNGWRANVSRLSVITGMTRKEVASLLKGKSDVASDSGSKRLLEHRAIRVLRGWTSDPLYKTRMGRPLDLPLEGDEGRTFASLVRAYAGDVTPISVLRELERLNAITRTRSGQLRPRIRGADTNVNSSGRFREFGRLLASFSSTAAQVLLKKAPPLYFGFKEIQVGTDQQAENFKESFGRRAALLLDGVEHWSGRHIGKNQLRADSRDSLKQCVGLGVYLVHTRDQSTSERVGRKR